MTKLISKALVVVLALGLAFTLTAKAADSGADTYKAKCASCHGPNGDGAMAKKLGSKDLNSDDVQKQSDADLIKTVTDGKGKMPSYKGKLTDDQIKDVVKFVKTLKKA